MTYTAATAAIRNLFDAEWRDEDDALLTPVAYDDTKFTKPAASTWVRLNIQHHDGNQVSIGDPGNNRHRRYGMAVVQIFAPQDNGSIDARAKTDAAFAIFFGQTTEGVTFDKVYAREIGNDGQGWYQINLIANFYYDDIT